jgi:hypothetical protein
MAATEAAMVANSNENYPVIVAQCVAAGANLSTPRPAEISLPPSRRPEPPLYTARPDRSRGGLIRDFSTTGVRGTPCSLAAFTHAGPEFRPAQPAEKEI